MMAEEDPGAAKGPPPSAADGTRTAVTGEATESSATDADAMPQRDAFISYASQDAVPADAVVATLERSGLSCWIAPRDVTPGALYADGIIRAINGARVLVLLWSKHSSVSAHVGREVERAASKRRPIITLRLDEAPLAPAFEYFLSEAQWIDVGDAGIDAAAAKLATAIRHHLTARTSGTSHPGVLHPHLPAKAGSRRQWVAALVAVVGLGLAAYLTDRWRHTPASDTAPDAHPLIEDKSVAVLPFTDMSETKDQEYFSDGLAEELLNLLGTVPGLHVAARTSAFSFKGKLADIPAIGRQLLVAHVLEGSVRKVGNHLRVTAQLVRADNGYQLWSQTFDRQLVDVFKVQDEIAAAVVKALKVSLLGSTPPRAAGTATADAYLVLLQGRAKVASQRLVDVKEAVSLFTRAIELDPNFGLAYVELAGAKLLLADFEVTGDRGARFAAASGEGKALLDRALALNPNDGHAYVERASLRAFTDLKGAEQDYRRGLELDPNNAHGYEGLAAVLYEDPLRRDEALAMLDRAHLLDPLEPKYAVLKSLLLLMARSDQRGAERLLEDVVARYPQYEPALMRLADLRRAGQGRFADAIVLYEEALKLDPLSEWTRRQLIEAYMDVGDPVAAGEVAAEAQHQLPIQRLLIACYEKDWRLAAEIGYGAFSDQTVLPPDEAVALVAIRVAARETHEYARARALLERISGVTWPAKGTPEVPLLIGMPTASIALGDILIASGEKAKGEQLLRAVLANMAHVAKDLKRGDYWYLNERPVAFALLGERTAALDALRKSIATGPGWQRHILVAHDPAYETLRSDPRFEALMAQVRAHAATERRTLDRYRADGRVPVRVARPAR